MPLTGLAPLFNNFMLANFATDADVGNYKAAIARAHLLRAKSRSGPDIFQRDTRPPPEGLLTKIPTSQNDRNEA
jgi:hypothetical protein